MHIKIGLEFFSQQRSIITYESFSQRLFHWRWDEFVICELV